MWRSTDRALQCAAQCSAHRRALRHNTAHAVQGGAAHTCDAAQHTRCRTAQHAQCRAFRSTVQCSTTRAVECSAQHSAVLRSIHRAVLHGITHKVGCGTARIQPNSIAHKVGCRKPSTVQCCRASSASTAPCYTVCSRVPSRGAQNTEGKTAQLTQCSAKQHNIHSAVQRGAHRASPLNTAHIVQRRTPLIMQCSTAHVCTAARDA